MGDIREITCSSGPSRGASAGTKSSLKSGIASLTGLLFHDTWFGFGFGLGLGQGFGVGVGPGLGLGLAVEVRLVAPRHQREAGTRLGVRRVLAVEQRLHQCAERVAQPEQRQLFHLLAEQRAGGLELLGLGLGLGAWRALLEAQQVTVWNTAPP